MDEIEVERTARQFASTIKECSIRGEFEQRAAYREQWAEFLSGLDPVMRSVAHRVYLQVMLE